MPTINRRDFLKVLAAASLSPLVRIPVEQRAQVRKVYLRVVRIAGAYFYDGMDEDVLDGLKPGDELELRREPDNPYDEKAIEVYTLDGYKLGYVPRIDNPIPAALADQDVAIGAEVYEVYPRDDDYRPVSMRLYMLYPREQGR